MLVKNNGLTYPTITKVGTCGILEHVSKFSGLFFLCKRKPAEASMYTYDVF